LEHFDGVLGVVKEVIEQCTAECKMLLFHARTIVRESDNIELARLKKKDQPYVVIKAYKFIVFEIWRDFNVLSYIACPRYPYIRVYRRYDTLSHFIQWRAIMACPVLIKATHAFCSPKIIF